MQRQMEMLARTRRRREKILPHERDADDVTPLLGADLNLRNDDFDRQSNEIAWLAMEKKTDLIAIPELSEWKKKWKENCHECVGVIKAPDVDLKNETKFLL